MIVIHLLIGGLAVGSLLWLRSYASKHDLRLRWYQWLVTILAVLYAVFVLELIIGFLAEGAPQAALVMGLVTGIVAVIWFVLLGRFVFAKPEHDDHHPAPEKV